MTTAERGARAAYCLARINRINHDRYDPPTAQERRYLDFWLAMYDRITRR